MEKLNFKKKILPVVLQIALFVTLFLVAEICFYVVKPLYNKTYFDSSRNGVVAQSVGAVFVMGTLIAGGILFFLKKLTVNKLLMLIVLIGFFVRLTYILYTPASVRQHDTITKNNDGHFDYAWIIYSTGKLPKDNVYQFYHPPLNAVMQALFMRFSNMLAKIFNTDITNYLAGKPDYMSNNQFFLYSTCQILSLFYSLIAGFFSVKILKMFKAKGVTLVTLTAFVMLFPRTIQFSGQLNNDGLSFTLAVLSLYFAVKWWKQDKKIIDIILCALFLGLGMNTKLTTATVALPIAGIFITEFVRTLLKRGDSLPIGKMILQYGIFLSICAPIGLWFQVYAKIRFNQNLGYVFDNLHSGLLKTDYSIWQRFGIVFDKKEWFGNIFCRPFDHYNLFIYLVRSSIFGEFSYWQGEGYGVIAQILAFLGVFIIAVSTVYYIILLIKHDLKDKSSDTGEDKKNLLFIVLLILSQIGSEIYFYIKMPYGCTMDFRYIMPIILGFGLYILTLVNRFKKQNNVFCKILNASLLTVVVAMVVASTLFYMVCI